MLKSVLGLDIPQDQWHMSAPWVRLGRLATLWMFGGLVAFAAVVSISGAVVSSGTVTVEGNYKTIQHLDGGIVSKILVRNGDLVQRGDELMRLEDTAAQANLAIVMGRMHDQLIQQARLIAERDRNPTFELPELVRPFADDPQIKENYASQKSLFAARRASHKGELSVLGERRDQVKAELGGQQVDLNARKRQLGLATKELADIEPLFKRGFANQQRLG
jgi:epimerase transport system membrane fusion protein